MYKRQVFMRPLYAEKLEYFDKNRLHSIFHIFHFVCFLARQHAAFKLKGVICVFAGQTGIQWSIVHGPTPLGASTLAHQPLGLPPLHLMSGYAIEEIAQLLTFCMFWAE